MQLWREPERRRLVRLCTAITGDRDAAEDLAQETLLEAWRNLHKLRDPAAADRWLAAIARNVCLRWARRRGRDAAFVVLEPESDLADDLDLDVELERQELEELLDRALALLTPETRAVLVQRYVTGAPHAEIAAGLGLSEDAVSMRLTRGKAALRRLLASQLRDDAAEYGLSDGDDGWRETRVWCAECGRQRLLMRRASAPAAVSFRCLTCDPDATSSEYSLGNPLFARLFGSLVRPTAILARAADWSSRYFASGAESDDVECTRCGRAVRLRRYVRDRTGRPTDGLLGECEGCGEQVCSSTRGLALALPQVRQFSRDHPRSRLLPHREVDLEGTPALVVRHEDVLSTTGVDVFFARDTLRVLRVATG